MIGLRERELARFGEHDLAALIDLYEANYVRVMRLAPDLHALQGTHVSRVAGALDLYLQIEERSRYTTSLTLTYRFRDEGWTLLEPNARVYVYHDVHAAEVVSHSRRRPYRSIRSLLRGRMPVVERKWDMNRFLLKWLRFCSHQGHLFLSCTARTATLEGGVERLPALDD